MEETAVYHGRETGITGSTLKLIAVVTMFIDHFAACYLERVLAAEGIRVYLDDGMGMAGLAKLYLLMRLIGRVAFPIFVFLLVEGFLHTRNRWKYLGRLCVFALVSEIPFDMAFFLTDDEVFSGTLVEFSSQNVFFTLAIGLLVLIVLDKIKERVKNLWLEMALTFAAIAAGMGLAALLRTDYDWVGVLAIAVMWIFREHRRFAVLAMCVVLTMANIMEITAFLAFFPIIKYNGARGMKRKLAFYAFYPAHLLLLWGLCVFMGYMK